jgi:hypothetical protein
VPLVELDFLGVTPSASQDDINKAYRKKSKLLHPDKVERAFIANKSRAPKDKSKGKKPGVHVSKAPSQRQVAAVVKEATERSARLNTVANILRGPSRERYDYFLKNGFPKWKGTGYYYTRFRPGLGTVVLGLFLVFGGVGHYLALILSWKRQREFVDRYIRHARKAAWGDELGFQGIAGLDVSSPTAPSTAPEGGENGAVAINRRQKRMMERESRKEGKKGGKGAGRGTDSGTTTPVNEASTPTGDRRRVVAENGKVLIVDSIGNVFLEEETEDGETQEFLLDIDEIPRPTLRDTVVFRLPVWWYRKTVGRLFEASKSDDGAVAELAPENHEDADKSEDTKATAAASRGTARRRGNRSQKH